MILQWISEGVGKELSQAVVTALAVGAGYWSSRWQEKRMQNRRYRSAVSTMSLLHSRMREIAKKMDADAARIVVTHNSGRPLADSVVWKSSAYCIWCKDNREDMAPDVWVEHPLDQHYLSAVLVPLTNGQPVLQIYREDLPNGSHLRMVYESMGCNKAMVVLIKSSTELVYASFGFVSEEDFSPIQIVQGMQAADELGRVLGDD